MSRATSSRSLALLTPSEMSEADRLAACGLAGGSYALMEAAGAAVMVEILARYPAARGVDVLCGPGNNGGDGYVVARLLREAGIAVRVHALAEPRPGSDAERAAHAWAGDVQPLSAFRPSPSRVVVDALLGAGLSRPLDAEIARIASFCRDEGARVVAVDLPSGVSGESGRDTGGAFAAGLTITFFRRKPGHLLEPGRSLCGETVVAQIGIRDEVLDVIRPAAMENGTQLWLGALPRPSRDQHKYSRGHAAVFSGGPSSTGAARLSAMAAARIGAGAVTVLSPGNALAANASHLTSIMLKRLDGPEEMTAMLQRHAPRAFVLGPGFGDLDRARVLALQILEQAESGLIVLDADGITAFRDYPEALFRAAASSGAKLVLTPHEGEFRRLFPDLADDGSLSKLDKAREAAQRAGAVVVYKGPDTVIAAPDRRAAINANGTPWLATAGSGDVLAGFIAGLGAQNMPAWETACAAVWMHAEAAARFGPGLIAEDLPAALPPVLRELLATSL